MFRTAFRNSLLWTVNRRWCSPLIQLADVAAPERQNTLRILTYHRVDEPASHPHLHPGVHSATPKNFAKQLDYLGKHFRFVSLADTLSAIRGQVQLPPRALLVTFDDAYRGFAEYAWPVLARRNVPVALFVPTAYPDNPKRVFWWDRLHWAFQSTKRRSWRGENGTMSLGNSISRHAATRVAIERVKALPHNEAMDYVDALARELQEPPSRNDVLTWSEIRELSQAGVELEAHTHTHPLMNRISIEDGRTEASQSRDELKKHVGRRSFAFAYPAGGFDDQVSQMLADEGFEAGFTTQRGVNHLESHNPLQLRRINVGTHATPNVIHVQLLAGKYIFSRG